ncbi:hypothetical protein [Tatumella sp. UBA2305]|uniref:hypothetical protein n=1 Tax=Tatumella sp. UBA2305 TaxID=1947647 RepID=UPI0025CBC896|nr:hypothetical protein [Tatumella sp. UBA2305]
MLSEIPRLQTVSVPDYQLVYFTGDVPQYVKVGLYKTGLPDHGQVGNIALISNDIDDEHHQVKFLFDATVPFTRLDSPLPRLHCGEQLVHQIIYGSLPQIPDSGHVVERMLKGDQDNLVPVSKRSRWLNPFIAGFSRKTLRTFMESESHQQMLQGNAKGLSGKLLSEKLSRSLSEPYIEEPLSSLRSLSQAIQNWSVIKWIIFGSLFSWLLMPLFTAWNHAWFPDPETGRSYLTPFTRGQSATYSGLSGAVRALLWSICGGSRSDDSRTGLWLAPVLGQTMPCARMVTVESGKSRWTPSLVAQPAGQPVAERGIAGPVADLADAIGRAV